MRQGDMADFKNGEGGNAEGRVRAPCRKLWRQLRRARCRTLCAQHRRSTGGEFQRVLAVVLGYMIMKCKFQAVLQVIVAAPARSP